ncbi:hypothetical protein ACIG87_05430 [Micromonospora sp. NPDC051925]|uniref:hypothetical protein n=1 Tax=Micromonospora sp. NPDC051925 TaxID=3364288 RepID=UPI0037C79855
MFCGVFGALTWVAAQAAQANPDHLYHDRAALFELVAVVMIVCSVVALLALFWPFLIEVDDEGLTLRLRGFTTRLAWESVESLAVVKVGETWEHPYLKLRLAPGVRLGGRLASKRDGRRMYTLLALDDLTATPEEVVTLLHRYGRGRFEAEEYVRHRAARRSVARFLRGEGIRADPQLGEYLAERRRIEIEDAQAGDLPTDHG